MNGPDGMKGIATLFSALVGSEVTSLSSRAAGAMAAGVGTFALAVMRPEKDSPFAGVAVVLSGRMSDADIQTLVDFLRGFEQDASQGSKQEVVANINTMTKPPAPPEGGGVS